MKRISLGLTLVVLMLLPGQLTAQEGILRGLLAQQLDSIVNDDASHSQNITMFYLGAKEQKKRLYLHYFDRLSSRDRLTA